MLLNLDKKLQSKFIKFIKNKDGDAVFCENMKREVIRNVCATAYKRNGN